MITVGEPEFHCWCHVCGTPTRVRVPLHVGATVASVLEICPGCGTGHDRPSVTVTPQPRGPRLRNLWTALARRLHARACRRKGLPALPCAYGECQRPGLYRHEHVVDGEDGTWRYVFCSPRHKRAWAAANGLRLEVTA